MADTGPESLGGSPGPDHKEQRSLPPSTLSPQKRKADGPAGDSPSVEKKAFTMNLSGKDKPKSGISISLDSSKSSSVVNSANPSMKINIGSVSKKIVAPVKMSLSAQPKDNTVLQKKSKKVASVFNDDSESDEEEMPPEAKMRMRNLGRDTPTAAGPNSFGKSRLGFCDRQKMIERDLKRQMEEFGDQEDNK